MEGRGPDYAVGTMNRSDCSLSKIVMPSHTNSRGSLYGGVLLAMMDEAAAIVSRRHSRADVVTAHIDSVDFLAPILQGQLAQLCSTLAATGRTSMKVDVEAYGEDLKTGERWLCTSARFVMVAVGEDRRPIPVPPLEGEG